MALKSMRKIKNDYYNAQCVCNVCGKDSQSLIGIGGCSECMVKISLAKAKESDKT